MKKQFINENWRVSNPKIGEITATVPGCVHTDLIADGQISDIFWRDNNQNYQWIENESFTYTCTFDAEKSERAVLVFEGLDTYCDIYLNGKNIGRTDDMFVMHRFDVSDNLKHRDNKLEVCFRSPVKEVEGQPEREAAFTFERLYSRRIQCTYGWDWVDRFVTCGIFRPVYIEYGNDINIESLYVYTENIDSYSAQIYVEFNFADYRNGGSCTAEIISPDGDVIRTCEFYSKEPKIIKRFDIDAPRLWYPAGYGEHPLYTIRVTVGENVHTESFGIRTIKILQLPDKEGSEYYNISEKLKTTPFGKLFDRNDSYSGFQVIVNGKKILCCGANWVPCEPFPSAETEEKFDRLISMATEMGVNMLRVWGGGIFENKYFYDCCDRAGILVTQDFLMACGTYPEEQDWFIEKLRIEADFAVKYLRNHPCLAWWSGDNENATYGNDKMENYRGRQAAYAGLASAIYTYDHARQFLPSSPYGGDMYASLTVGTTHNTNALSEVFDMFYNTDCSKYKECMSELIARFVAEEPTFGAVSKNSALRFMSEDDIADPEQKILKYHTKNNPYLEHEVFEYTTQFALKVLGEPTSPEDRYFKYKYIQYEWVRLSLENLRRNIGYYNGIVFWMFSDCWPAALGWSFIDYYCMPKAAFYQFKRGTKKLISSVTCEDSYYKVTLSNSDEKAMRISGKSYLISLADKSVIDEYGFELDVADYSANSLILPWAVEDDKLVVCDVFGNTISDRSFYKTGKLLIKEYTDKLKIISRTEDSITVKADEYIHVVELEGDFLFDDDYFSLLAGEEKTIKAKRLENSDGKPFTVTAYNLI